MKRCNGKKTMSRISIRVKLAKKFPPSFRSACFYNIPGGFVPLMWFECFAPITVVIVRRLEKGVCFGTLQMCDIARGPGAKFPDNDTIFRPTGVWAFFRLVGTFVKPAFFRLGEARPKVFLSNLNSLFKDIRTFRNFPEPI